MKSLKLALLLVPLVLTACSMKVKDDAFAPPPDVAAPPANALKTPSGLASKVLTVGLGSVHPTAQSHLSVHYTGWTTDGKMFESSYTDGKPVTCQIDGVIPGWKEALQLMVQGEKRRFWIPGNLAYDKSTNPNDPKGMLVFDIELLEVR